MPKCVNSKTFYDWFAAVSPFRKFVRLETPLRETFVHLWVLCAAFIGFCVYAVYTIRLFAGSPNPFRIGVVTIPTGRSDALFQFAVAIPAPCVGSPTAWRFPFSNKLTGLSTPYELVFKLDDELGVKRELSYIIHAFNVTSTLDSESRTSKILELSPCRPFTNAMLPIVIAINNNLNSKIFENIDLRDDEAGGIRISKKDCPTCSFEAFYVDFDRPTAAHPGMEMNVEFQLTSNVSAKTLFSSSPATTTYEASFASPFIPVYQTPTQSGFRNTGNYSIRFSIKPQVTSVEYFDKGYFEFLGSLVGIIPLFIAIGSVVSSIIWTGMSARHKNQLETLRLQDGSELQPSLQGAAEGLATRNC